MSKTELLTKLGLLVAVLVVVQLATEPAAERTLTPEAIVTARDMAVAMPQVLYLGDSTIEPGYRDQPNPLSTASLLADDLTDYSVGEFAHAGYSLIDYDAYLHFFVQRGARPRFAVIPINLRSFSPTWDSNPNQQFERERLYTQYDSFLFRAFFKPMATFGILSLNTESESDYRVIPFFDGTTPIGTMADLPHLAYVPKDPAIIAMTIRALYAGAIPPDHRLLEALRRSIRLCRASEITPVLYITPVDYTTGDAYLEGAFSGYLRQHVALIERVVSEEGAGVLDLSRAFEPEVFRTGQYYAEEHLVEQGRRRLAAMLSQAIQAHDAAHGGIDAL